MSMGVSVSRQHAMSPKHTDIPHVDQMSTFKVIWSPGSWHFCKTNVPLAIDLCQSPSYLRRFYLHLAALTGFVHLLP